jgi:hypothetical protein
MNNSNILLKKQGGTNLSNYVPFTGSPSDVVLGNHSLTVGQIISTSVTENPNSQNFYLSNLPITPNTITGYYNYYNTATENPYLSDYTLSNLTVASGTINGSCYDNTDSTSYNIWDDGNGNINSNSPTYPLIATINYSTGVITDLTSGVVYTEAIGYTYAFSDSLYDDGTGALYGNSYGQIGYTNYTTGETYCDYFSITAMTYSYKTINTALTANGHR